MEEREYLLEQMNLYGRTVLASPQFRRTFTQTHHFRTTVGDHSVNVTLASLWLCRFLSRFGIHTDPKRMTTAALCHDLGIIGRYDKFNSNRECCRQHPIDSAAIAKELLPNADQACDRQHAAHMGGIYYYDRRQVLCCPGTYRKGISYAEDFSAPRGGQKIARIALPEIKWKIMDRKGEPARITSRGFLFFGLAVSLF